MLLLGIPIEIQSGNLPQPYLSPDQCWGNVSSDEDLCRLSPVRESWRHQLSTPRKSRLALKLGAHNQSQNQKKSCQIQTVPLTSSFSGLRPRPAFCSSKILVDIRFSALEYCKNDKNRKQIVIKVHLLRSHVVVCLSKQNKSDQCCKFNFNISNRNLSQNSISN